MTGLRSHDFQGTRSTKSLQLKCITCIQHLFRCLTLAKVWAVPCKTITLLPFGVIPTIYEGRSPDATLQDMVTSTADFRRISIWQWSLFGFQCYPRRSSSRLCDSFKRRTRSAPPRGMIDMAFNRGCDAK